MAPVTANTLKVGLEDDVKLLFAGRFSSGAPDAWVSTVTVKTVLQGPFSFSTLMARTRQEYVPSASAEG